MRIAIIGCGLIGRKRALALQQFPDDQLVAVCDVAGTRAEALAQEFGCEFTTSWHQVLARTDVDIVINASINSVLSEITTSALRSGRHVLCEKPLGRNAAEAEAMQQAAEQGGCILKTGFNHRFHPALWKARTLLDEGRIGDVISMRARYGHGSRPGMESEWRSSRDLAGGGELLDQGVHIIDLMRWYGGEVRRAFALVETKFWEIEVEDTASAILKFESGATGSFQVSLTNWRNVFSFEIFGTSGYLTINGLGGSYGPETLEMGIRKPEGGRPDIESFEFPANDESWVHEWREFRAAIAEQRRPIGDGIDGVMANRVVEALYRASAEGCMVPV